MKVIPSKRFLRATKRRHGNEKAALDGAIRAIQADPQIGVKKIGDLAGILVHKFRFNYCEMLIAYGVVGDEIRLYDYGTHENFYRDLK